MKKSVEAVNGMRLRALVSLLCLVALGRGYAEVNGISDNALQQIAALQAEKAARTPAQLKLDSQLVYALKQAHGQPFAPGVTSLRLGVKPAADGRYLVDIDAQVTQNLLDTIAANGGQVVNAVTNFNAIRALLPLDQTEVLAGRADVRFIKPAVAALTRTGSVDSQGDTTHRAAQARAAFYADGSGVKVGVLSDSVDFMAQAQATGDLPPNVTVLPGQASSGTGEGTAMLEIVYDLAPGAQLFFATGNGGDAQFAQNILDLRAAGCDIIIDDVFYFDESPFQDSIVTRAVNTVTADGALYFSAAGNEGSEVHGTSGTWEGDFADGGAAGPPVNGKGGNLHSFGATAYDTVTGVGMSTVLHWSDPLGASTNDYDLYVLDSTGANIVSSSTTVQNGTQDPFEIVAPPNVGERIVVVKASGDPRFLHIDTIRGNLSINTDGNITGHATATNAFACAAVDVHTAYPGPFTGGPANPVESFSTDGPRRVFYNADGTAITPGNFLSTGGYVRQKPDISAADGVATTLPSNSGLNPFYGTSAAAPHAGAIAALVKSYNLSLSPSAIRNILTSTALDNEAVGYDYNGGYGIVMAYQALQATPAPGLIVYSTSISGGNGNGVIDYNECNDLNLVLINRGTADATHVSGLLVCTNAGVVIAQSRSAYPNLPTGGIATNLVPFRISTSPTFVCGTPITLTLILKTDQRTSTNNIVLPTGQSGMLTRFDNPGFYPIPDNDPIGVSSPMVVSNITSAISKVSVSLVIAHPFDADLQLELIAPDGTTCLLSANNGSSGRNYGVACTPDTLRTTFDDAAGTPITAGTPPFMGTYQPETPLAIFSGKTGTNANGIWQLHVVDQALLDVGAIQCWSLSVYSTLCTDGGGTCPGANLALGLTDTPDPVFLTSNLVYTISVTNFGPSIAKGVIVSQVLPTSSAYVGASASQGGVSFAGGTVTASLGTMDIGATATVTVTILPTTTGVIYSTASVTSLEPEIDPSDNSATVATVVNPPASDLAVGLAAAPNPALVGGVLTYSVSVTNFGPVAASGVTVATVLPPSVGYISGLPSQGYVTLQPGNVAVCNFGALGVNRRATATLQVVPGTQGTVTATATATANQNDPLPNNNTASVSTAVGPAADLEVSLLDVPNPVVKQGQLSYKISVINHGPSTASSVVLNGSLASGLTVTSNSVSQGSLSISNGTTLFGNLGSLPNGATVTAWVFVKPTVTGTARTTVSVASPEADPNPANNIASAATVVADPFVAILPAGASLLAESFTPANGAIDIGETVTLSLRLANRGNVGVTNLWATLLAGNGVSQIVQAKRLYGNLAPSDTLEQSFTFTATGTNGGTVTATLQLSTDGGYSTTASYVFALPNLVTFANTNLITIPDSGPATPYPSAIQVAGVSGQVSKVTATLTGLSHTYPHDVNVLLVGPSGASTVLMAHVADQTKNLSDVTLTFDDAAPAPLPAASDIFSSTWQPTAYSAPTFPSKAPAPPYPVALAGFNGVDPNGNWSLYVYDDSPGDQGQIANGWSLVFTTVAPISQLADVGLAGTVAPNPVHVGDNMVCTFAVSNAGPATANSVAFTDVLPVAATLLSATNSQQTTCSLNNGTLSCNLANLSSGAVATVTLVLQPTVSGWITNAASITGSEVDIHLSDNTLALAANVVSAYAELGVSQTLNANPLLAGGSNATFTITVTNAGPNAAVGVLVTNLLPPGFTFVSANPAPLSGTNGGGAVAWNLGNLDPASVTAIVLNAAPVALGIGTNLVTVSGSASLDTNLANNAASLVVTNLSPVIAAGASLTSESFLPPDGTVEPGERIVVSLSLANAGLLNLSNVVATLQPSGGITSPSGAQAYGLLASGGAAVARSFGFTAGTPVGGVFVATLALQNGTNDLGTVTFSFAAPATNSFANANAIIIPDHGAAAPYPAQLNVAGLSGLISKVTVTLNGFTHAFPSDVSAVLVNPAGASALLMSHCGGGYPLNTISFTLDDAAGVPLPASTPISDGGVYQVAAYNGAVTLPGAVPTPYGGSLAALNGTSPNGAWKLYVFDDSVGDSGNIAGGWTLNITTLQPVNPVADLAVRMSASPSSVYQLSTVTYTITVTNQGPATASGVVLSDVLPAGVSLSSPSLSQGSYSSAGGTVNLNLGSLAAGAGASATLQVAPAQAGSLVNTVRATLNEIDLNLADNTAQTTTSVLVAQPAVLALQPSAKQFQIIITAQPGLTYTLQTTTNLLDSNSWSPLATMQAPADGILKYLTTGAQSQQRYYRVVRMP